MKLDNLTIPTLVVLEVNAQQRSLAELLAVFLKLKWHI
jgi:hypothetical protein